MSNLVASTIWVFLVATPTRSECRIHSGISALCVFKHALVPNKPLDPQCLAGAPVLEWKLDEGNCKSDGWVFGQGRAHRDDGATYEGFFLDGFFEGHGTFASKQTKYEGDWNRSLFDGKGVISFAPSSSISATFKNGRLNGHISLVSNESTMEGESKTGEWPAFGTETWADGATYTGEYKDSARAGHGTHVFADGGRYEGQWKADKPEGEGTKTWATGDKYVGGWKAGVRNGHGRFTLASGDIYDGQFKDDKYEGIGTLIFADGSKISGRWREDKFDGGKGWNYETTDLSSTASEENEVRPSRTGDIGQVTINAASKTDAESAVLDAASVCMTYYAADDDDRPCAKCAFQAKKISSRVDPSGSVLRVSYRTALLDAFGEQRNGFSWKNYFIDLTSKQGRWQGAFSCSTPARYAEH